jgi:hypothetical protein
MQEHDLETDQLRAAALEHAMRTTSDASVVIAFKSAEPSSKEALTALGHLASVSQMSLFADSPLAVFCRGGHVDTGWRSRVQDSPNSLWGELEMLNALYSPTSPSAEADHMDNLNELRKVAKEDLAQ